MIPELAFNQRASVPVTDVRLVEDRLPKLMPKPTDFSVLGSPSAFVSNKANLEINDLTLVALSHTPYLLNRSGCRRPEIWIPLSGRMVAFDGETQHRYGEEVAFFCASETRNIKTSTISAVGLRFDMQRLNRVHCAMAGLQRAREIPAHCRTLALMEGRVNFLALFQNMFRQIDELDCTALALERLAIDDSFYRLMIGLLKPDFLHGADAIRNLPNHSQGRISKLCEFLQGNLDQPVTLTDMERISGLSARVLQYNFQKAFGLRPKQWLRKQRLHAARAVLLKSDGAVKLTALACDYCFPSPSVFSRAYQMEFGELPSETLARKRAVHLF